jgi:hypothetical protein
MQQNDASFRHGLDILDQTIEIQVRLFRIIISILANLEARILKDGNVISPGRIGKINVGMSSPPHQFSKYAKSTGPGQRLNALDSIFDHGSRLLVIRKLECPVDKFRISGLQ